MMHEFHDEVSESEVGTISFVPSVRSQIQNLSPTRNVVAFYMSKLDKYEKHVTEVNKKFDEFCLGYKHQLSLEKRVRCVMNQNENLRTSLTCLRSVLAEERQNMLQMKIENARLKLQEVADHKKIQHLSLMNGASDEKIITFLKNDLLLSNILEVPPSSSHQPNKAELLRAMPGIIALQTDNDLLRLQIKALEAELSERMELTLKERDVLISEKEAVLRDYQLRKNNDAVLIEDLTEQLEKMQSALQDYYRSFATLPNSVSMPELQLRGKDQNKLVQMVSKATSPIKHHVNEVIGKQASHSPVKEPIKSPRFTHVKPRSFKELNSRLKKSTNLCRQHERKIRSLQEEVSRLKQQLHNECQDGAKWKNMKERIAILTARNGSLERRRKLDCEGFKSDVTLLRAQLHDIQRQLLKISLIVGKENRAIDLSALEAIDQTKKDSAQMVTKLKDLKSRLSEL